MFADLSFTLVLCHSICKEANQLGRCNGFDAKFVKNYAI